jgi:hypothetical protein
MVNLSIVLEAIDMCKISGDHINVEVLAIYKYISVQGKNTFLLELLFYFVKRRALSAPF